MRSKKFNHSLDIHAYVSACVRFSDILHYCTFFYVKISEKYIPSFTVFLNAKMLETQVITAIQRHF